MGRFMCNRCNAPTLSDVFSVEHPPLGKCACGGQWEWRENPFPELPPCESVTPQDCANVQGKFPKHFSLIHGEQLNSWADYNAANKRHGLIDTGERHHLAPGPHRTHVRA